MRRREEERMLVAKRLRDLKRTGIQKQFSWAQCCFETFLLGWILDGIHKIIYHYLHRSDGVHHTPGLAGGGSHMGGGGH